MLDQNLHTSRQQCLFFASIYYLSNEKLTDSNTDKITQVYYGHEYFTHVLCALNLHRLMVGSNLTSVRPLNLEIWYFGA